MTEFQLWTVVLGVVCIWALFLMYRLGLAIVHRALPDVRRKDQ